MKKIQISEPVAKQIEINGHVFDVRKGDAEILEYALEISQSGERYKQMPPSEVVRAIIGIKNYTDEILGEGAMAKIANGKPINIIWAIDVLRQICDAIQGDYTEGIAEKYE